MALTFTQVSKIKAGTGVSVSGAIGDMAVNSLMVAVMAAYGNGQTVANHQASDTENLAYTTTTGLLSVAGSSGCAASLHFFQNSVAGSASSGNCSAGSSANGITAVFYEIAGASTVAAWVAGEASGSTGASTAPTSSAVVNSVANSIIIAGMTNLDGSPTIQYAINQTGTVGTYLENTSSGRELAGNSFMPLGTVYQIVSSSVSQKHVWQSSNQGWATVIAAFGAAGGVVTTRRPLFPMMGAGR